MSEKDKNPDFQVVRDCEILFFMPKGFGEVIDNDVDLQRKQLVKSCDAKSRNMSIGHSSFRTLVDMGLVEDHKPNKETRLTLRGKLFLEQEKRMHLSA
jgi:predicted transcriptional regulator